ncbi:Leucine-rich repeat receptor-like protein kinase [Seminavis robusta]|uniref:Leucine-rich repeat receptor-like protein kinase n=1 Tax=Seminavis robusta TaxID=568900 RepID=A0A9N8DDN4_9STRA|nr:Leucine-rich repeat receptor-like protein kinase [Seminavis robusta]|eukprot:Sro94_g048840.1 Leucine-rich repeat receptor-like protein kinase (696) ;mRNA; f:15724-18086
MNNNNSSNNNEDLNPYGDLEDHRSQHSTYSYEDASNDGDADEESRGLIKPSDSGESDLAMAVVDILSCCDSRTNTTQAKLLRDMEARYQNKGNLILDEKQQREIFADEIEQLARKKKNKSVSSRILETFKPKPKLLREFGSSSSTTKNTYSVRSSRGITGEMPVRKEAAHEQHKSGARKLWWVAGGGLLLLVFVVVVVIVVVVTSNKTNKSNFFVPSSGGNHIPKGYNGIAPMTTECFAVNRQEHPHVLSQCACNGIIAGISEPAEQKYRSLLNAFGAEYLHANETMSSCSSRNQALVWLAEDPGSVLNEQLVQRHALVLFFVKLHGLYWTLEEGLQEWLTPNHECTWYGVSCNSNNQVVAVELWNLNLDGSIPKEIMSLTHLQTLSLPENRIQGRLPTDAFVMMPKLTDLTLFMNSMSGSIDGSIFDHVTKLRTLNLDSNDLTGTLPSDIGKLSALEELKLARNNLKGSIPTEIGNANLLQKIELEENNLDGTLPSEMGKLNLLKSLNLSWNNFHGTIPWEFQSFRKLVDLFLKSNNFSGRLPEIIKAFDKLENLVVSLNSFTGELPSGMEHMVSLTTVHLDENQFNGTVPSALGACSMLRDINLEYNDFHGAIPSELGELRWLVSLSLEGNGFQGTMPTEVCGLRGDIGTLSTLTASCTAVADSGREKAEVFAKPDELICTVPECCTACKRKG